MLDTGAIVATTADYAAVRELVADVFAEGIEATVPTTVRTVDAVAALKKNEVSLGELAAKLALDKSITSRRLRDATDRGYLVNLESRRGQPARIVLGDLMPVNFAAASRKAAGNAPSARPRTCATSTASRCASSPRPLARCRSVENR
jgi:hypothetical protein